MRRNRVSGPREVETACFHAAKEALANIALHANATEVWVSLRNSDDELHLSVRDNGAGFDAGGAREGLGLAAMAERVRQVAGRMHITSNPGGGTEIQVRFFPGLASDRSGPIASVERRLPD